MTNRPSRPTPHATQPPATLQSAHENIIAARVKTKVWLELGGEFFVGDGGIHLLGGILQHGSLAQTVREIGWSYRHAWGYLRRADLYQQAVSAEQIAALAGEAARLAPRELQAGLRQLPEMSRIVFICPRRAA